MRRTLGVTVAAAGLVGLATLVSCPGARAGDLLGLRDDDLRYEFFEHYLERIEGVTTGAGNAKEVNAVTHMIDPWPRNVRNRHIPGNGDRMTGAVDRYRRGRPAAPPINPIYNTTGLQFIAPSTQGAMNAGSAPTTAPTQ